MKEKLDNSPFSKPLYAQVYDILVEKISNGEFKKEDILPTESEFQELFGVSRITARKALEKLTEDGYIRRARGIGSIVIKTSKNPKIELKTSFSTKLKGKKIKRKILEVSRLKGRDVPIEIRELFELNDEEEIIMLKRLLSKEEIPVLIQDIYLAPCIKFEVSEIKQEESFYEFLESKNYILNSYTEKIFATIPTQEEQIILEIKEIEPLLCRERKGYLKNQEIFEYSITKHISKYYDYMIVNK